MEHPRITQIKADIARRYAPNPKPLPPPRATESRAKPDMHTLVDIDQGEQTAFCLAHQKRVAAHVVKGADNLARYRCGLYVVERKRPYMVHRKDACEGVDCKWVGPFRTEQLTVDHIDGNHSNNDVSNLMTLCHNCHVVKSRRERQTQSKAI